MNPDPGLLGVPISSWIASLMTAAEKIIRKRPVQRSAFCLAIHPFALCRAMFPFQSPCGKPVGNGFKPFLLLLDSEFLDEVAGLFISTSQLVPEGLSGYGHLILEDIGFLRILLERG